MKDQNYKNHKQFSPLYHFFTVPLSFVCLALAINNVFKDANMTSVILLILSVLIILGLALMRLFSLKAQDRAIRAEENLRYFSITGKLLDKELRIGQITALRFAGDNEFIELVDKAKNGNMNSNDIKQSIKNWRADHHRV